MIRSDFYTIVHKHVRRSLFDISIQLGGVDRANVVSLVGAFRGIVGMLHGHAQLEDLSIGPMLREISPDLADALLSSHAELDQQLAAVEAQVLRLPSLAEEFETAALDAYRAWNRFLSDYLIHLDDEETRLLPALGSRNPPASGVAALVAQRGEHATTFLSMLLPIIAHVERVEILSQLRDDLELFDRAITAARSCLGVAQMAALESALR